MQEEKRTFSGNLIIHIARPAPTARRHARGRRKLPPEEELSGRWRGSRTWSVRAAVHGESEEKLAVQTAVGAEHLVARLKDPPVVDGRPALLQGRQTVSVLAVELEAVSVKDGVVGISRHLIRQLRAGFVEVEGERRIGFDLPDPAQIGGDEIEIVRVPVPS